MTDNLDQTTQQFPTEAAPQKQEGPNEEQKQQQQQKQESDREQNIRIMRERAEAAERKMAELERMVHANMAQQQPKKIEVEDDLDIADDNYLDGRQAKKIIGTLKKEIRDAREEIKNFREKSSLESAELRIKAQFTDFYTVVNEENLKKLSTTKPLLYKKIMENDDMYERGYLAYEMIKGGGIFNPNAKDYEQQDKQIENNKSKPRSGSLAGPQASDSPLTRAGEYDRRILTEAQKEQIRKNVELAKSARP